MTSLRVRHALRSPAAERHRMAALPEPGSRNNLPIPFAVSTISYMRCVLTIFQTKTLPNSTYQLTDSTQTDLISL